ncbi:hypothetical protein HYFRA_00010749 [Hymenoscyphus fraxineus]|uniref:Heterokaryon incompatibility domain-containing protein n=1 Tax=Hymenoscyphus fraxineus TaxID=746836 RepID=A0A9N9L073_9HELO|nr:hypothetical protein HYFRA_00010749 [Hymenoscyphus fraxineus]
MSPLPLKLCNLCRRCRAIYSHERPGELTRADDPHNWRSNYDLRSTASKCPYCAILWQAIRSIPSLVDENIDKRPSDNDLTQIMEPTAVFWPIFDPVLPTLPVASSYDVPEEEESIMPFLLRIFPLGYKSPCTALADKSIAQVKSWIKDCSDYHRLKCTPMNHTMPTRLIRIEHNYSTYNIALVEPHSRVDYLCLSHQWGSGGTRCKTLDSNITERLAGISWDELPILFQQAIDFTRRLGIQYLWIDSLCIIQDNDADWHRESMKMANIFRNGQLTLGASHALNADSEFLFQASEEESGIKIEGLEIPEAIGDVFVRLEPTHHLETFPLLRRAWVYQERLLSPRFLHFSKMELIWECNTVTQCQCSGGKIRDDRSKLEPTSGRLIKQSFWEELYSAGREGSYMPQITSWEKAKKWNDIVQAYSCLDITFEFEKTDFLRFQEWQSGFSISEVQINISQGFGEIPLSRICFGGYLLTLQPVRGIPNGSLPPGRGHQCLWASNITF